MTPEEEVKQQNIQAAKSQPTPVANATPTVVTPSPIKEVEQPTTITEEPAEFEPKPEVVVKSNVSEFEQLLDELTDGDEEADANEVYTSFVKYAYYYMPENMMERYIKKLVGWGYSKKLLRAAKQVAENLQTVIGEALAANRFFPTYSVITLIDMISEHDEVDVGREWQYITTVINPAELDPNDCTIQNREDLFDETLALLDKECTIYETESKLGKSIENCLKSFSSNDGSSVYFSRIRKILLQYAIGLITAEQFKEDSKFFRRKINSVAFDRYKKHIDDAEIVDFVGNVVLTSQRPEWIRDQLKLTEATAVYIDTILDLKSMQEADVLIIKSLVDFVEPEVTEEETVAKVAQTIIKNEARGEDTTLVNKNPNPPESVTLPNNNPVPASAVTLPIVTNGQPIKTATDAVPQKVSPAVNLNTVATVQPKPAQPQAVKVVTPIQPEKK